MGRLSNRDVDALTQMQYEDALADDEPWANEAFDVRQWAALDGKHVVCESECGTDEGVWQWRGPRGDDFYLVYINTPDGELVVGTDPRNFTKITVLDGNG